MFCVPFGAPGPLRAPSGGPRGPNNQTKVTATLRPAVRRVWRLRAGSRGSPRPRNTAYRCAESFRRDRRVFKTLVKHKGLEPLWHPRGPKHVEHACLCVFFAPRRLPKRPPEGQEHKTQASLALALCRSSVTCEVCLCECGPGCIVDPPRCTGHPPFPPSKCSRDGLSLPPRSTFTPAPVLAYTAPCARNL